MLPWRWRYLWQWWCEIATARPSNGMALSALPYSEMEAWARCTGRNPTIDEYRVIRLIDNTYLAANADDRREKPDGGSAQRR